MRALLVLLVGTVLGRPTEAQVAFKAGDAETTVTNIYHGLFAGVALLQPSKDSALRIIRVENDRQRALDGRAPGSWERRVELNRWRDSTLRVLLRSDGDRRAFDANSERLRPQGKPPR